MRLVFACAAWLALCGCTRFESSSGDKIVISPMTNINVVPVADATSSGGGLSSAILGNVSTGRTTAMQAVPGNRIRVGDIDMTGVTVDGSTPIARVGDAVTSLVRNIVTGRAIGDIIGGLTGRAAIRAGESVKNTAVKEATARAAIEAAPPPPPTQ